MYRLFPGLRSVECHANVGLNALDTCSLCLEVSLRQGSSAHCAVQGLTLFCIGRRLNKKTLAKNSGVKPSAMKVRCSMWGATFRKVFLPGLQLL
jgi:hypothetical protein